VFAPDAQLALVLPVVDGYDTGIRYVDDQVAQIVQILQSTGIYDETAIIISADHGENQGQLGIWGEHATADKATTNVPLIIRWPGGARGGVDRGLHYQLDLAPTLMELLHGDMPSLWDGRSYAGAVTGRGPSAGREELDMGQCAHVCQRSVRFDRWLYIRTFHCGFHLFPEEMLFDLIADPQEQDDVAGAHPQVCRDAAARLARWHDRQMRRLADACAASAQVPVDPMQTVLAEGGPFHAMHDPARSPLPVYLERLEATGRTRAAEALRFKYPM
jgi:arylsulfatase A-like enzyme